MEKYIVNQKNTKYTLTAYMIEQLGYSSRQTKLLLKGKKVFINGRNGYWDSNLKDNDLITIDSVEKISENLQPQDIPIDILYEDEHILSVNKPPYMLMHPTPNHQKDTLANAISYYYQVKNYQRNIRFLNRLDMNTSGIVIVPKTPKAHSELTKMMNDNKINKYYLAVVEGNIEPEDGTIDKPISKDIHNPIKQAVSSEGQKAITIYKTLDNYKNSSLIELQLITGRTHQIRVHMSYIGHALIGDSLYGKESGMIKRQALYSHKIVFKHPVLDALVDIQAPMPEDMSKLIQLLRK